MTPRLISSEELRQGRETSSPKRESPSIGTSTSLGRDNSASPSNITRSTVKERIRFCFFEREGDGFGTEGAADFFEGVEGGAGGRGFLDEVDVGEAALF